MKKSVTFRTILSAVILLLALIPFLFISSCQKEEQFQPDFTLALKSGVIEDGEPIAYWEDTFTRKAGKPEGVKIKIGSEDLQHFDDCFIIKIKNGNAGGTNRISSAIIKVDGKEIFGARDFSMKVCYLEKEICVLTEESEIEVELRSEVGSFIEVCINGTLLPGNALISEDGGQLVSEDDSLIITIPENNVTEEIIFSVLDVNEIIPPEDFTGELIGSAYFLEPDGYAFQNPVMVKLLFDQGLFNNVNNIRVLHWDKNGNYEIIIPDIDIDKSELSFEISHFSYLAIYEEIPDGQTLDFNVSQTINTIVNILDSDLDGPGLNLFGDALKYAYTNYNKWDLTEEELNENSKVTVFAILNNIPYRTMTSQSSSLPNDAALSGNHLLKGSYTLGDLTDGTTLTTIDGKTLTITHSGDDIYINNSKYIEEYDNINGNIVHAVYNQIFCSEDDLSLTLGNCQELLKDYIEYYYLFDAILTDESGAIHSGWNSIDGFTFYHDDDRVGKLYFDAYNILSRMVDISETFDLSNNLSFLTDPLFINSNYARLRSMRAYVYFILQNYFHDVAILPDNCHNYELSRNNISEVWDYILSDITYSHAHAPISSGANDFIFTKGALWSLSGRINLLKGDYTTASNEFKTVIDIGVYALEYPIDNIYNTASIETILGFTKQGILSSYLYEERDIVPVFRFTEVILNYALSELETGDIKTALTWMQMVNDRSTIGNEITGTEEELKEILFQMITREIHKEGTRLMYLKYFDKAELILEIPFYKKWLPIPFIQLIYDPYMTQNPGY